MTNRHPVTNEHVPPMGFPTLPDGREVRDRLAAAALLGLRNPDSMWELAKRRNLTIFKGPSGGTGRGTANYYLLSELLDIKAAASQIRPAKPEGTEAE